MVEVLTKQDALELIKPLQEQLQKQALEISSLRQQLTHQSRTMKMPEVQQVLGLTWSEVKTRIQKKIIPARRKGTHWVFNSSDIYHLSQNPDLLKL